MCTNKLVKISTMNDNYSHNSCRMIYVTESIPGPADYTTEYEELQNSFNSQIAEYCNCKICEPGKCLCLLKSGGANYTAASNGKLLLLKDLHIDEAYPMYECNDYCKCSYDCGNRYVQKGPVEGLYVKENSKGLGLYTNSFIPKGTFICEYAGEIITKSQAVTRQASNQAECKMNYILCLQEFSNGNVTKTFIDPSYIGNIGRYINHSCSANCNIVPVRVNIPMPKLAIFCNSDIAPHMEITFNYGSDTLSYSAPKVNSMTKCLCNSQKCTGWLPYEIQ